MGHAGGRHGDLAVDACRSVFFGGDAAFGPEEHHLGGRAGPRGGDLDRPALLHGEDSRERPAPGVNLVSQKMGIHEWSYDNDISLDRRYKVPWRDRSQALHNIKVEVELGFDARPPAKEAQRCLNCDVQTVFTAQLCIECDACVDICPIDCITFTANGDEADLRTRLQRAGAQPRRRTSTSPAR